MTNEEKEAKFLKKKNKNKNKSKKQQREKTNKKTLGRIKSK
jgi:hypothetical protein